MQITFLGVGEAIDERCPNTSILIRAKTTAGSASVLLDCGYTAAHQYWLHSEGPDELDVLWISHFHGDHFMGVPPLLLRFKEEGRAKPLIIMGQTGITDLIWKAIDLTHPSLRDNGCPLEFVEVSPGNMIDVAGLSWRFAENQHSKRDLAVRIEDKAVSLFYSGDGKSTPDSLALARGCDLIIHEAYGIDSVANGHGGMKGCIAFAQEAKAPALALVHVQREVRRKKLGEVKELLDNIRNLRVWLPEPGEVVDI